LETGGEGCNYKKKAPTSKKEWSGKISQTERVDIAGGV